VHALILSYYASESWIFLNTLALQNKSLCIPLFFPFSPYLPQWAGSFSPGLQSRGGLVALCQYQRSYLIRATSRGLVHLFPLERRPLLDLKRSSWLEKPHSRFAVTYPKSNS